MPRYFFENQCRNKHVESLRRICLDTGSSPVGSTKKNPLPFGDGFFNDLLNMNMLRTKLLTVVSFFPFLLSAQKFDANKNPILITPAFESLYSTHGNFFYSGSVTFSKMLSKKIELGAGIERASSPIHHDNGFVLYRLRFLPVHGNIKYHFKNLGKWHPYAESSVGISFNKYQIASDDTPEKTSAVNEKGVFLYAGLGLRYAVFNNFSLVSGVGIKGYKMSFNVDDINPHGVSYLVGVCFKLK